MASFYKWRTQSFDYEYDVKTGEVMRFIAGTRKGILASVIQPMLPSAAEAKREYLKKREAFARTCNR